MAPATALSLLSMNTLGLMCLFPSSFDRELADLTGNASSIEVPYFLVVSSRDNALALDA